MGGAVGNGWWIVYMGYGIGLKTSKKDKKRKKDNKNRWKSVQKNQRKKVEKKKLQKKKCRVLLLRENFCMFCLLLV